MVMRKTATVSRTAWRDALQELALACADSGAADVRGYVIDMNALLLIGQKIAPLAGVEPVERVRLDTLLSIEAYETAVMEMLHHGAGYLMSRGGDGRSLATVTLPGTSHEHSGAGATPALALIGAIAMALATMAGIRQPVVRRVCVGTGAALH